MERNRQLSLQRGIVRCWRLLVLEQNRHHELMLRAGAHQTLRVMWSVLQHWRSWATDEQLMKLKQIRAGSHWQAALQQRVLDCWELQVQRAAAKWQQVAKASCWHQAKLLTRAVKAWMETSLMQQGARAVLVQLLQQWEHRLLLEDVRSTVSAWQSVGQQQVALRQLQAQLMLTLQAKRMQQLLRYHKQLAAAAAGMRDISSWWWLLFSWGRWRRLVDVMQGQRGEELQQLVQLRACVGTWLKFVEQQRHIRAQLVAVKAALRVWKLRQLLPAWSQAAQAIRHKHEQQHLAQRHFEQRQLRELLLLWQTNATDSVHEQAWQGPFLRKQQQKRALQDQAAGNYQLSLQRRAFMTWQAAVSAAKAQKKQLQMAAEYHSQQTLRASVKQWQDILRQSREDRQQLTLAAAPAQRSLAACKGRRVLAAWRLLVVQKSQGRAAIEAPEDGVSRFDDEELAVVTGLEGMEWLPPVPPTPNGHSNGAGSGKAEAA
eukprot:gene11254-11403_t